MYGLSSASLFQHGAGEREDEEAPPGKGSRAAPGASRDWLAAARCSLS